MNSPPQSIAVLGSTGSIGCGTLEVVSHAENRMNVQALSSHSRLREAVRQAHDYEPRWLIAADAGQAAEFDWTDLPADTELLTGPDALEEVAASDDIDTVVAAIVGSAGLRSTWTAVSCGKRVALANKETMVVAGPLVRMTADQNGAELLPVDSELCAIFQALQTGRRDDVARVILTASGGPFRNRAADELENVTVADALAHPTWKMGKKISVDSATMMNKALEIIEARWFFDLEPDQIEVVVHPQSIVHSMVEYVDGSVISQMSPPDMRLPIQYALTYPVRAPGPVERMDFETPFQLQFHPPDRQRFPALDLGYEVARMGGTSGAVVNAANEVAVEEFLQGRLQFTKIVPACRAILENHNYEPNPSLSRLLELDGWARQEVLRWVAT